MDADGKDQRRLTHTRATERAGAWAPDGMTIAFAADGNGPGSIYVVNVDGSKIVIKRIQVDHTELVQVQKRELL